MSNNLTGDYEAVLQVSVRQINGLLATLHQNGATKEISPSFMHSEIFRVGQPSATFNSGIQSFNKWLVSDQDVFHLTPAADGRWTADFDKAPPGIVGLLEESFVKWKDMLTELATADTVHGIAHIQFSTPRITFEHRTSQVFASVCVRAHYFPDPGSQLMPKPVHGRVEVLYAIHLDAVTREVRIPVPADDSAIQFYAEQGTGLSPGDRDEIATQIRNILRKSFKPMLVPLPPDFQFVEFKALGTSANEAVALPIRLSQGPPPVGGLASVTNHFLGASEFAVAVSKEYVQSLLQPLIATIKTSIEAIRIGVSATIPVPWPPFTTEISTVYRGSLASGPTLTWSNGFIELAANIDLKTVLPNQWVNFQQKFVLELNQAAQTIALKPLGDPDVQESTLVPHSDALDQVRSTRDQSLVQAAAPINQVFSATRDKLRAGLRSFDNSATADFTSVDITLDGIIVRGTIGTKWHYAPVVDFEEVNEFGVETRDGSGNAFTARRSWIPGGRITNFKWTWVENRVYYTDDGHPWSIPWGGKVKDSGDKPHEFIFPKPEPLTGLPRWAALNHICLDVTGTQISADGVEQQIAGGIGSCKVSSFEPMLTIPPGIKDLLGPAWQPPNVLHPDAFLDESIFAHVSAGAEVPPPRGFSTNRLVHFVDWRADQPLAGMDVALGRLRSDASLAVTLVLPVGSLHATRGDVEARLGLLNRQTEIAAATNTREARNTPVVPFSVTEDYEGDWSRTFGVKHAPASFIVNARGEFVWQHEGAVDAERLTAALFEHLLPAAPPRARLIELSVRPGERVPHFSVVHDRGESIDLRRLRGRQVLLNFFRSWTQPCISELRRLQALSYRTDRDSPFIVAVSADSTSDTLADIRHQHQLTFTLAHDADRRISRLFQVACWPTTVSINKDGIVDHIQFGTTRERSPSAAAKAT